MPIRSSHAVSRLAALALSAGATVIAGPAPAGAQGLIFDWGGEKTTDSGKQHIKFNGPGKPGDMIVSFGDRKLYFFTAPGEADTYPVAIPREQSRWEGVTTVSNKRENPSWTPTAHMLAENPRLPRWVPGGHPMNPLGNRAMYLGSSDYRIHGTDAPWTIGTAASKGCVRMFNKDVADLYPRVKVGSKVTVTWQKFDGRTLEIANTAKPVADPDSSPQNRAQLAAYSNPASASPAVLAKPGQSRARKYDADDVETIADAKPDNADKPANQAAVTDDSAVKRRRSQTAEPAEPVVSAKPRQQQAAAEAGNEPAAAAKKTKPAAKTSESRDSDAAASPREERKARTASVRQQASVSTEQAAHEADPPRSVERSSLAVAERALAAAERAAEAAERAAAAAERAVAATQQRAAAISGEPAVTAPSVVAH